MLPPLDTKFYGIIHRAKDHRVEPPDGYMVFVARDNALLPTLEFYRKECERQGAEQPHLLAIDTLIGRICAWREKHPEQCKVSDVEPGELT